MKNSIKKIEFDPQLDQVLNDGVKKKHKLKKKKKQVNWTNLLNMS